MKRLYIMCGVPGSGKSTYVRKKINENPKAVGISRDAIRFAKVAPDEPYFSHEPEVINEFVNQIKLNLTLPNIEEVYADATHLNPKSRKSLLDKVGVHDIEVYCINFNLPLETCLARNEERKNTRSYVSPFIITKMFNGFKPATFGEHYKYTDIIHIKE